MTFKPFFHLKSTFKSFAVIFVALSCLPAQAFAECNHIDAVYTDRGKYIMYVNKHKEPFTPTWYNLILENTESGEKYEGQVVYGNGFSIPGVSFTIHCPKEGHEWYRPYMDEKEFCKKYAGTVYTIDGNATSYGFSRDKPMLFPKLAFDLNYAWGAAYAFPRPGEVWHFKDCSNK